MGLFNKINERGLEEKAKSGNAEAQYELGSKLYGSNDITKLPTALDWLKKAQAGGNQGADKLLKVIEGETRIKYESSIVSAEADFKRLKEALKENLPVVWHLCMAILANDNDSAGQYSRQAENDGVKKLETSTLEKLHCFYPDDDRINKAIEKARNINKATDEVIETVKKLGNRSFPSISPEDRQVANDLVSRHTSNDVISFVMQFTIDHRIL